jgi:hypothetical protein
MLQKMVMRLLNSLAFAHVFWLDMGYTGHSVAQVRQVNASVGLMVRQMPQRPRNGFAFLVFFAAGLNQGEGVVWKVVDVFGCPLRSFKTHSFYTSL